MYLGTGKEVVAVMVGRVVVVSPFWVGSLLPVAASLRSPAGFMTGGLTGLNACSSSSD